MSKALTKEDLVYILQGIFRLSTQPDNAFQMLDDGLYVKDYQDDFNNHTGDTGLHITQDIRDILIGVISISKFELAYLSISSFKTSISFVVIY